MEGGKDLRWERIRMERKQDGTDRRWLRGEERWQKRGKRNLEELMLNRTLRWKEARRQRKVRESWNKERRWKGKM